jgi:hypothetical protein
MENTENRTVEKFRGHWFFDFDGTLARTGEDIILAWKKSIADMGLSCPHFDEVFKIGPTLEKMAYELFDNVTPELVAELTERFKPNYDESGFPNTVPYPGVIEKLNHLKEQGSKIYIVTNKRHAATQKIVKALGWEDLFDGVWSFDSFADARYKNEGLGIYEGALYCGYGAYRPNQTSIMRQSTIEYGFNAPSREAIYYRIHKLAFGAEWEYDYEEFVEWDAINRNTAATRVVPYRLDETTDLPPLPSPVVMNKTWREAR